MSNEFVEKDGKLVYIIIIVVLALAVLGLGGYIIYDKYIANVEEVVEKDNESDVSESRELTASEVNDYLAKVQIYNKHFYNYYLTKTNKEITNKEYLAFAYAMLDVSEKDVTVENVIDVLEKYFGKNHKVQLDDIYCMAGGEILYDYDEVNNIFIKKEHAGHGGIGGVDTYTNYVSSKVDGNRVTLVVKNLYARYCSDICGPLNTYYKDPEQNEVVLGDPSSDKDIELTKELFETIVDDLYETTYNFIIEDNGNFYLDSVSIDK